MELPRPWDNKRQALAKFKRALAQAYNYYRYGTLECRIGLEASSTCQLKCPKCARTCSEDKENFEKVIDKGHLSFSNFKRIVDDNPWIRHIELSNWGEMFLNPQLKKIMEYSYDKNIELSARNGVNLNTISEEIIECLVRCKFRYITVSIDGASDETYKIYRRGGDFDKVLKNIKKINFYKQKYNTRLPELRWQFIVFGHNEHELPIAREKARELNMSFHPKVNWALSYSPVKNKKFVMKETGWSATSAEGFAPDYEEHLSMCHQLWGAPQINWDGRLLGCCLNIYGDFGNVFESSLRKCLKSKKYIYTKKCLLGKKIAKEDIPCSKCSVYTDRLYPLKRKLLLLLDMLDGLS